jgi:hypothetical protein
LKNLQKEFVTPYHRRKNKTKRSHKNRGRKFWNFAYSDKNAMAEFCGHSDEYVGSIASGDACE